jgi:hypothetical protein
MEGFCEHGNEPSGSEIWLGIFCVAEQRAFLIKALLYGLRPNLSYNDWA